MKPLTTKSIFSAMRCSYRSSTGRQCQRLASDFQSTLCPQHRAAQKHRENSDISFTLAGQAQAFQTAQGINHSLGALYRLLAGNRISPRRAAVLAYINSLLLRTLPAIDADNEAGITDPTKPPAQPPSQPLTGSATDKEAGHDSDPQADPEPGSHSGSDSVPNLVNTWDPCIPDPDPRRNHHEHCLSRN
jgi:hypothetical protein